MHKIGHKQDHLPMQILEHFQQEIQQVVERQLQSQLQTKYSWKYIDIEGEPKSLHAAGSWDNKESEVLTTSLQHDLILFHNSICPEHLP